jgi:hypothetical protein
MNVEEVAVACIGHYTHLEEYYLRQGWPISTHMKAT